jgi:transposase
LCVDEVYQGQLALLLAVDPAAPDGDRLVGYQLVHGSVDATLVEAFLTRLKDAGVDPDQVITDGSALYPMVLSKVWPSVVQQLCLFHATRKVTKAVLEVISSVRRSLPVPPPRAAQGRGGPRRSAPPTEDLSDLDTQRWHQRQAERQRLLAEVHALTKQGLSQRAIARQLRLHRQTVKAWLQQEPLEAEQMVPVEVLAQAEPAQAARRHAFRPALFAQVQQLAQEGLSYTAIAHQLGMHRVTVSAWLRRAKAEAPVAEVEEAVLAAAPPTEAVVIPEPMPPAGPPAPWESWKEVQQVREALQEHRFLFLRREEHLTAEHRQQIAALCESPIGDQVRVAREFLEEWYGVWRTTSGERRALEEAQVRFEAWQSQEGYKAVAPLRQVQERMTRQRFERLSQFLREPGWEATNNGAERMGRAFRHRQAAHFNLRTTDSIEGALIMAACQRQEAAMSPAIERLHRCQRGRKQRRTASVPAIA